MPFNSIFAWVMKKRIAQIALFKKLPLKVQENVLKKLIKEGANSEFGKKHRFETIQSIIDFQKEVPLQDYESLKPLIERIMNGEQGILWSEEIKWFAKSSGTTENRSKFIPVSKDSLWECHYKGGKDLLALYYENFPNRKLYKGKHLIIGGSAKVLSVGKDGYQGDLSAIIMKNLPWWAELRRTPSKDIALLSEWEEKLERMAESTINEDVYIVAGVPSWTYVLLKRILEKTGKKNLREVWPNLELFMHGGVSFEPYRKAFQELIPFEDMHYVETYNASEGFFGIQDQVDSSDLLLMLDYGIFYEFIPLAEFNGTASEKVISLSEVALDQEYAMVISTNSGLWRYVIGDTVRFTSLLPFRFKITGRTKHFINAFGEEVVIENAENAIREAAEKTNAQIREYTVAPVYLDEKNSGQHQWLIEFERFPNDANLFIQTLDETLRSINSDYDAKRYQSMVLKPPLVFIAKEKSFEEWLRKNGKLGGQNKIPRLQNNRTIMEQLLQVAEPIQLSNENI